MTNGPVEPGALQREAAHDLFQIYVALTQEGFTEQQALTIIGQVIGASFGSGGQP